MKSSMVTGRMSEEKKKQGNAVLEKAGLSASQAINLLYSKLIEEQDASFLSSAPPSFPKEAWNAAASFVDSLCVKRESKFDSMSIAEIKLDRLKAKGLM